MIIIRHSKTKTFTACPIELRYRHREVMHMQDEQFNEWLLLNHLQVAWRKEWTKSVKVRLSRLLGDETSGLDSQDENEI